MKRLSILAVLSVLLAACGGGGSGSLAGSSTGGSSSSSSSSSGGTPPGSFQYGGSDSTAISVTAAIQDANGNLTLKLDEQSFKLRITSNGYAPVSEFGLSVDAQGATMQICQNGVGLFNVFPADAVPVTSVAEMADRNFLSVSFCTTAKLQGDYLSFNSLGIGVHFNASQGKTNILLPAQVSHMLSPSCGASSDTCLRPYRIVRNGAPLYFIHAPWPDGLRLWQGPGLTPF
jgi:hypothetical protein